MTANVKPNQTKLDLCEEREDLLSSVQSLKERINLTEQTLSSLSTPRCGSPTISRQDMSRHTPALTLAEIRYTPRNQTVVSPLKYSGSSPNFHFTQYKPGSDMVDASLGNLEAKRMDSGDVSDRALKMQLRKLQQNHTFLEQERNQLQSKLEQANIQLTKADSESSITKDDISTYKKLVSQLQETIVCLEGQVKAQDNALRKSEMRHTGYKEDITDGNKRLKQCSEMLKLTEERMLSQQKVIKSLRVERESALNKLDNLEVRLAQAESFESTNLVAAKKDLQNYQDANTTLAAQNKDLSEELSAARHELSATRKELESKSDEVTHISLTNNSLSERVRELTDRLQSSECEVIEAKTLCQQNTDLHKQRDLLTEQLQLAQQALHQESHQKVKEIESLKAELHKKTSKLDRLEEQFGLMENGLLKQKQRMGSMETELQRVDYVKMENIELKCKLEESERKLILCQQEISVTSQHLGKLENLATRIENRESLSDGIPEQESATLRSELKEKQQEISRLCAALDDADSKLRLAQLASTAKEKVQKKSDKLSNNADKTRLMSEVSRLKSRLTEGETKCEMLETRLKEVQAEMCAVRKKYESIQLINKNLKQQKLARDSEIKALRSKIGELEKSSQMRFSELEDSRATIERLQRQILSLRKEVISKSSEKDDYVENLQQQLAHWQQQVQKQKEAHKSRLADLQEKYSKSQEVIVKIESQLETKEKGFNELRVELESASSEKHAANSELSRLAQTSNARMVQLESTLSASRAECESLNRQLAEEKAGYDRQLNEKDKFIKEYQNRLKASQNNLKDTEMECSRLQNNLQLNKQTEAENAGKVRQLEEEHVVLSSQVHNMEHTLKRVGTSHKQEISMLNDKLRLALENLEESKIHIESLSSQIDDLLKDKAALLAEVTSLESKVSHSNLAEKSWHERFTELDGKLKHTQDALHHKEEEVIEMEERLQKMELDLQHNLLLNTQFEGEFRRAQNDLKSAMGQCEELQEALTRSRRDKTVQETRLREAERSLRRAQEELHVKTTEVDELEVQVSSQEKQLVSRAQQVSKLDVTINSYKHDMESQLQDMTEELRRSKEDCNGQKEQLRRLNDKYTQIEMTLDVRSKELAASESLVAKLHADLQDRSRQVLDLERRLDGLEEKSGELMRCLTTRADEIDVKNDLIRRCEDQVERMKFELTESKVEKETIQEKYTQTREQLQQYLETVYRLEQRLIECENSQDGKSIGLEDARKELQMLQAEHKKEIARLEEAQSDFTASKENMEWSYQSKLLEMETKEKQLSKQLQLANDQNDHLRNELRRRLELVRNANEAVVIKEAEIARLEAKVSGIERKWIVTKISQYPTEGDHADYAHELPESDKMGSPSVESELPALLRGAGRCYSPIAVKDDELLARREKASRVLFPTLGTATESGNTMLAEETESTSLLRETDEMLDDSDEVVSHDDTLAKEREELFNRLDELNSEPIETVQTRASSQATGRRLILSSQATEGKDEKLGSIDDQESASESLSTVKDAPAACQANGTVV
ncbi:coiled-coil domain-containing protein 18-like isoform X2 [Watersipora subatra]|uniref:coiled-coil domain-containing protein 18-like isoform X2 n=1 Tax=Watersipora subatra TaxID=2589382 RepID=UPI00355C3242